jgi:hypothetical protein
MKNNRFKSDLNAHSPIVRTQEQCNKRIGCLLSVRALPRRSHLSMRPRKDSVLPDIRADAKRLEALIALATFACRRVWNAQRLESVGMACGTKFSSISCSIWHQMYSLCPNTLCPSAQNNLRNLILPAKRLMALVLTNQPLIPIPPSEQSLMAMPTRGFLVSWHGFRLFDPGMGEALRNRA